MRKAHAARAGGHLGGLRRGLWLTGGLAVALVAGALLLERAPPVEEAGRIAETLPPAAPATPVQTAPMPPPDAGDPDAPGRAFRGTLYTPPRNLSAGLEADRLAHLVQPGIDGTARTDAVALPALPNLETFAPRAGLVPPPSPEDTFVVDERGLVIPDAEGRLAPEGYVVIAGRPAETPPQRPVRTEADLALVVITDRLSLPDADPLRRLSPRARPAALIERRERAQFGGKTTAELAYLRPQARPPSAQSQAQPMPPTAQAIAAGPRPAWREEAAQKRFAAARAANPVGSAARERPSIEAAAVATPIAETPENVQASARSKGRMDLGEVNLLGTYGSRSAPRALVRLPGGQVIKVSVGDRVDGGRVAAIGDGRLDYTKGGRTRSLTMPRL